MNRMMSFKGYCPEQNIEGYSIGIEYTEIDKTIATGEQEYQRGRVDCEYSYLHGLRCKECPIQESAPGMITI